MNLPTESTERQLDAHDLQDTLEALDDLRAGRDRLHLLDDEELAQLGMYLTGLTRGLLYGRDGFRQRLDVLREIADAFADEAARRGITPPSLQVVP